MGLPDNAEQDRHGDGNVAGENQPGQDLSAIGNEACHFAIINTKGLNDASESMTEMVGQQKQRQRIEKRNERMPESEYEHLINVMTTE